jgi:hypothetical protein
MGSIQGMAYEYGVLSPLNDLLTPVTIELANPGAKATVLDLLKLPSL